MKERLFLIGGSGFIGKNLVRCLHKQYAISVYDKFIDKDFFFSYPDVKTHIIELDKDKVEENVESPDYIINLASIVTAERDLSLFDEMVSSNLKVLLNLYERFKSEKKLKLFIQFGSSEEYGNDESPFVETMRESPSSPYALVKQLTVNTALMLYRNYDFPVMIIRPGNLFGKYQNGNKFLPYVIENLRKGKPLDVTLCEQKRDFIYVDDFVWCVRELMKNYEKCLGEIINVASGESISLKHIIETCKRVLQSDSDVHYGALAYRENEAMELQCNINKMKRIIGKDVEFDISKQLHHFLSQK